MLYDNPDIYDAILPVSSGHLDFYTSLAKRYAGPVLELACGSGQFVVPIAAVGLPVTGIDLSPKMLSAARRRASDADVQVELIEGDMRKFDLGRQFQVVFVARNSLLHLNELEDFTSFFSSVRRHLTSGGVLAFDIFNPDVRILAQPRGERVHVMRVASSLHGEINVEATNDYDSCSQVNRATWFISTTATRDAWITPLHLRSIFPQELLALLNANGFDLLRRDGDFTSGSFTNDSSTQVCQCRPV